MPSNFHHPAMRHARRAGELMFRLWNNTDRLTHVHFAAAVAAAFLLHMTIYGVWLMMPRAPIMDIPVRVLNIKLGEMDDLSVDADNANKTGVEQIITKVVQEIKSESQARQQQEDISVKPVDKIAPAEKKKAVATNLEKMMQKKSKPFDLRTEGVAAAAPVMSVVEKQYVREDAPAPSANDGHALGNGKSSAAEVMARYEQMISAWIEKFKPEKVTAAGQPDKVTSLVRIRIDRRGNIRYMELDQKTGFAALDRAAIDTVRRANPVPPVPADYPSGESMEFIVPIVFTK